MLLSKNNVVNWATVTRITVTMFGTEQADIANPETPKDSGG